MGHEDDDLSYWEWYSFALSIFNNNILLAQRYAKNKYRSQQINKCIDDKIDELLDKVNETKDGLEELKKKEVNIIVRHKMK